MDGKIVIGTDIDTKSFDAQIDYIASRMEDIEDKLKQADMGFEVGDTEKLEAEYEKLGNQLIGLREKQEKFNQSIREAQTAGFERIKDSIDSVGSKLTSVTKKVGRWALAVFGVRSAYMFVRNAINTISQNDKQLANDIQVMKSALAYTIEPIVRRIVELAKTLMSYVAYIVKAWTGRDIFASAKRNLKDGSKSAKSIKKSLAGFDEANILNSNKNDSSDGISDTFKDLDKIKKPKWVQWLSKSKKFLSEILPIVLTIFAILTKTTKLGLYIAILGIYKTIKEIRNWLKEPTFENFMGILQGIALVVAGIAIAFGAWPVAIIAGIALIITTLIKNWDKIKEGINKALEWINTNFREWMHKHFGLIGDLITNAIEGFIIYIKSLFDKIISGLKKLYDGIVKIIKGDFIGGIKDIFGGLFDILIAPFTAMVDLIKNLWNKIKKPIEDVVNKIKKALGFSVDVEVNVKGGGGTGSGGSGGSGGGRAKGGIYYPQLASGGIINQPGKGVPYHGARIGERGAEAVVPLTDSQQMALLGEAIGRYITVNLTNVTELDGRTIARKVQEVGNNTNFLMNR